VWFQAEQPAKTPLALIYLHGFSGSRGEMMPVGNIVAKALHANIFYTRFTGHGRDGNALAAATVNDFVNDTVEALTIGRQIGEKLIVIGVSTGGTFATWLATYEQSPDIAAFILISPNFGLQDQRSEVLTWPWAEYYAPLLAGEVLSWPPANALHAQYWTLSYPVISLIPMMGLVKTVRDADFNTLTQPFLFVFSAHDKLIDVQRTENIFNQLASSYKQKIVFEHSQDADNHILAGDALSPDSTELLAQQIIQYIKSLP